MHLNFITKKAKPESKVINAIKNTSKAMAYKLRTPASRQK